MFSLICALNLNNLENLKT